MIKITDCVNGMFTAKCYGPEGAECEVEHWWAGGKWGAVEIAVAAHMMKAHSGQRLIVLRPPQCATA